MGRERGYVIIGLQKVLGECLLKRGMYSGYYYDHVTSHSSRDVPQSVSYDALGGIRVLDMMEEGTLGHRFIVVPYRA